MGSDDTPDSFEALLRRGGVPSSMGQRPLLARGAKLVGGRFEIGAPVGRGGMGVVYEAHDAQRNEKVALKTLLELDPASVYRFKQEFRGLADVAHPNLVRLHELFAEGALWFFTMDLIDGVPFDAYVRPEDRLDEARLRAVAPQVVAAITAIHAAGKLHRDLKPSNVLVTADARAAVLDFGLAVDPEPGGVGQTLAEQGVSGTPGYMAPEQAAGASATRASDYYAFGVMLFEAVTGRLPFTGRAGEMLAAKQTREAPDVREVAPGVPADLATLCVRLLALDPGARPNPSDFFSQPGATAALPLEASVRAAPSQPAPSELLGREHELAQLHEAYAQTLAGKSVVLFISGESGLGKSALVEAFLNERRARGDTVVLSARCYERENVPYKGFDALVDELSRYLRRLTEAEAASLLPREAFALARLFPVLDRVPVVAAAPKREVPDPHEVQRRAFGAFGEFLARIRDRQPLVAFIDDLQWIDQDSVRFLRHLLLHPEPVPALLVLAHRSEGLADNALLQSVIEAAGDNRALSLQKLELAPLAESALAILVTRLLSARPAERLARALALEARGSPFFAAELARATLLGAESAVPPSLEQALSLHVEALPAAAGRLLSALAIAGQPIAPAVAVDAAAIADGHAQLDLLRLEQLVRVSTAADGTRSVECYHDKIRELLVARIDAPLLRELSAGLARALAAHDADADPELLTRCLLAAALREQAAEQAARGAERALHALAFDRAARLYELALEHGRFDPAQTQQLRAGRAEAFALAGRGVAAAEAYLAAREGATPEQALELTRKAGEQYLICGRNDRGRELLGEALAPLGITIPRSTAAALASTILSRARLSLRGLRFTPRDDQDPRTLARLQALNGLTHCLVRSDPLRFADFSARAVRLALDSGHTLELARALPWELQLASYMHTDQAKVEPVQRLAEGLCARSGDAKARAFLLFGRGCYRILHSVPWGGSGDDVECGRADYEDFIALVRREPYPESSHDEPWGHLFLVMALWMLGRFAEASEIVRVQLDAAWARGDVALIPQFAGQGGLAYPAVGKVAQAEREIERARAAWGSDEVGLPDSVFASTAMMIAAYRGELRARALAVTALVTRVRSSFMARVAFGGQLDLIWGLYAAGAASDGPDGSERDALLREAKLSAKRLGSSQAATAVRAAVACSHGDVDGAVAELRSYLAPGNMPPIYTNAGRRRLGVLLGGDEGKALVREADAFFTAGGALDPEAQARSLLPGFDPPKR